nr:hypothetical protein [Streptomyces sp. NRRL B-3648]
MAASGVAAGLDTCLRLVRRGGVVNLVVSREIELRGAFRFDAEFDEAPALLAARGEVDGLISAVVPVAGAESAFAPAADRQRSCKVLPEF